jgi:hypothetical protein
MYKIGIIGLTGLKLHTLVELSPQDSSEFLIKTGFETLDTVGFLLAGLLINDKAQNIFVE